MIRFDDVLIDTLELGLGLPEESVGQSSAYHVAHYASN